MAKLAARLVKGMYDLATRGARTRLGNVVHYPDGTESKIVSGAGAAPANEGRPMEMVSGAPDADGILGLLQTFCDLPKLPENITGKDWVSKIKGRTGVNEVKRLR